MLILKQIVCLKNLFIFIYCIRLHLKKTRTTIVRFRDHSIASEVKVLSRGSDYAVVDEIYEVAAGCEQPFTTNNHGSRQLYI